MLAGSVVGCGSDGKSGLGPGDASGGGDDDAPPGGGDAGPPPPGFEVKTPAIDVPAHGDVNYCYYFHTSNTDALSLKKIESQMTSGVAYAVLFFSSADLKPPGTLVKETCDYNAYAQGPRWVYSASADNPEVLEMPADDGKGKPVGRPTDAGQSAFLQIHLVNPTSATSHESVEVSATAYAIGTDTTLASSLVTYNTHVDVNAGTPDVPSTLTVSDDCPISKDKQFFFLTSHTNRHGTRASIQDGTTMLLDGTPSDTKQLPTPHAFETGRFSYACDYSNTDGYIIHSGDDASSNEVCRLIGYFYPADDSRGLFCLNLDTNPTN